MQARSNGRICLPQNGGKLGATLAMQGQCAYNASETSFWPYAKVYQGLAT